MKSPQEWARDCLQRIDLAGAEASASEVVAVIVGEAVAAERERLLQVAKGWSDTTAGRAIAEAIREGK